MLVMVLPRRRGHDVMSMLSHADDVAAVTAWSRHDVNAESCR
jgi:hypothetical protein